MIVMALSRICLLSSIVLFAMQSTHVIAADAEPSLPKAFIDGNGLGWKPLGESDFVPVNGAKDTWSFKDGIIHCTGKPTGVMRSQKQYTNFEIVAQWKHLQSGGNSGIFVWAPPAALEGLKPGDLPKTGIEVQILDHGFTKQWEKQTGGKANWFTTNGDVFPVEKSTMKPFPPTAPKSMRSFPRKNLSKGVDQWNHSYVRCINGEIRLWVNGEEVSGGADCTPRSGYLCLESEGAPIDFKEVRIRELP
jgi:hypothetical protein